MTETLDTIKVRMAATEDCMTRLEANPAQIITEAKAAASVSAHGLVGVVFTDMITRLTRVEIRQGDLLRRLEALPT